MEYQSSSMNKDLIRQAMTVFDRLLTDRVSMDAFGRVEYIGLAEPFSDEGDPVWWLKKLEYGPDGYIGSKFPTNGADFVNSWTNRSTYTWA